MKRKSFSIRIKEAGPDNGLAEGQFIGYASVFDNVDLYGDVVRKGAFTKTLNAWAEKEKPIPLLFGHDTRDPNNSIGYVIEATEDEHGLLVKCQIDLEGGNGPQVYRLVKGRRLSEMSFAYDVTDGGFETKDGEDFFEIREVDLFEVSLVPIGANRETELLEVKAMAQRAIHLAEGLKAGRVISAKNEDALKEAQTLISEAGKAIASVLAAVAESESGNDEASGEKSAKITEEPGVAKVTEEPASLSSVEAMLAIIDAELLELG